MKRGGNEGGNKSSAVKQTIINLTRTSNVKFWANILNNLQRNFQRNNLRFLNLFV